MALLFAFRTPDATGFTSRQRSSKIFRSRETDSLRSIATSRYSSVPICPELRIPPAEQSHHAGGLVGLAGVGEDEVLEKRVSCLRNVLVGMAMKSWFMSRLLNSAVKEVRPRPDGKAC